ncbi:MAG: NAD(P)-dependent oxidoreductase [Bacteroidota bacterium]|nr:NAD(P)-dependent oxidoreductase [Bacteroidota bacterium]
MSKTVLITGALGFIGQKIAKEFKEHNYFVIGVGHGTATENQLKEIGIDEWHEADLNIDALNIISRSFDIIVHCAGGSTVGISLADPYLDYHKTVNSTLELLEYIRLYSPKTAIIYLSSAAVYGAKKDDLINEDDDLTPVSPYGFHKLASESICKSYSHCFGIKVAIVRLFSIYGEGLTKQLLWDASNKIITATNKEVLFYGTGEETRDWLHVKDVTKLVCHLAQMEFSFLVLNGAYGKRFTVNEVLTMLLAELNIPGIKILFNDQNKEGDPKYYHSNMDKALSTGWKPEIGLVEGLKNYVKWFKEYKDI